MQMTYLLLLTCCTVDTAVAIVAHALVRAVGVHAVSRTNCVAVLQLTYVSLCKVEQQQTKKSSGTVR